MAQIVAVHGIGQQLKGEHLLKAKWLPALRDGLRRADVDLPNDNDLICAFYGDLFRKKGTKTLGNPQYDAGDITDEWEQEMLEGWWRGAAAIDAAVISPDADTKLRTPQYVQRALNAVCCSRFWSGVAESVLIFDLKQVHSYLHNEDIRREVRSRVVKCIGTDTKVLIGHSLGSVVAYEALCEHPEWKVSTFVTLGSPLGIRNLIFDKLQPAPRGGSGAWPGSVLRWTNIADAGDIVALVKNLQSVFGDSVENQLVHNGATAHNLIPYLTAKETGLAIATGLTSS